MNYSNTIGGTCAALFRNRSEAEHCIRMLSTEYGDGELTIYPVREIKYRTSLGETIQLFEVTYRKWTESSEVLGY